MKTLRKGKPEIPAKASKEELQKLREGLVATLPPVVPPKPETKPETKPEEPVPIDQKRETIGYFLTPDGDIDIDRMNRPNIEKLRQLFNTPSVQKNILKVDAPPEPPKEPALPPVMIEKMYDAFSMLEVALATRVFKIDGEVAERVLPFNQKEKALLVPATTVVVDKYSGDWLKKYKDEVFLATMLLSIISTKIVQLRLQLALLERQKSSSRSSVSASEPANAAVPVPTSDGAAA